MESIDVALAHVKTFPHKAKEMPTIVNLNDSDSTPSKPQAVSTVQPVQAAQPAAKENKSKSTSKSTTSDVKSQELDNSNADGGWEVVSGKGKNKGSTPKAKKLNKKTVNSKAAPL